MFTPKMMTQRRSTAPEHVMRESDIDKIAEIHRQMRVILARDWDPIGVGDAPGAFDEYYSYVRGAYDVAVKTRSAEAVARHLLEMEQEAMGLSSRSVREVLPVAEKIVKLVFELDLPSQN
jgi:hypothetical protein